MHLDLLIVHPWGMRDHDTASAAARVSLEATSTMDAHACLALIFS